MLINFSLDCIALYFTGQLLCMPMRALRLIWAAALGSCFALASILLPGNYTLTLLISLGTSLVMCQIAFVPSCMQIHLRLTLFLHLLSSALAGMVSALYRMIPAILPQTVVQHSPQKGLFCVCIGVAGGIIWLCIRIFANIGTQKQIPVKVHIAGKTVSLLCLVDSGNLLQEPISHLPVLICSAAHFKELKKEVDAKIRIIPAQGVAGREVLFGFLADSITLEYKRREVEKRAAVAFCSMNYPGGSNGIIPASLLR